MGLLRQDYIDLRAFVLKLGSSPGHFGWAMPHFTQKHIDTLCFSARTCLALMWIHAEPRFLQSNVVVLYPKHCSSENLVLDVVVHCLVFFHSAPNRHLGPQNRHLRAKPALTHPNRRLWATHTAKTFLNWLRKLRFRPPCPPDLEWTTKLTREGMITSALPRKHLGKNEKTYLGTI